MSEPSIWAGSLLLHKQYVTPFAPMNVLEKMLRVDGYETFITRDSVLAALSPTPEPGDLDRHLSGMNYDLCRSLEELSSRLDERGARAGPVFAYTQPQNLHISVIQREGASAPPGKPYPGFYAPYASRLERMDSCFGKFVRHLKDAGRYDRSLIVLTADHGDSLGEEGRWGHAYTIFPEVVRIPLLIHLPRTSGALGSDVSALAFSTDIAPSLYYLLGHRPVLRGELAGRPLFTETEAERKLDPAVPQLLVSSYAPVYGTLTEGGRKLYIADGVNDRDYLFSIEGNLTRSLPVTDSIKSRNEASIREWIGRVNHAYRFGGESAR